MVNTVTSTTDLGGNVDATPQLPPKRQAKLNTPVIIPTKPLTTPTVNLSPPTYDAPPPPKELQRLSAPREDTGKLSDGEDYLPLEDKHGHSEAIYTSLEGKAQVEAFYEVFNEKKIPQTVLDIKREGAEYVGMVNPVQPSCTLDLTKRCQWRVKEKKNFLYFHRVG